MSETINEDEILLSTSAKQQEGEKLEKNTDSINNNEQNNEMQQNNNENNNTTMEENNSNVSTNESQSNNNDEEKKEEKSSIDNKTNNSNSSGNNEDNKSENENKKETNNQEENKEENKGQENDNSFDENELQDKADEITQNEIDDRTNEEHQANRERINNQLQKIENDIKKENKDEIEERDKKLARAQKITAAVSTAFVLLCWVFPLNVILGIAVLASLTYTSYQYGKKKELNEKMKKDFDRKRQNILNQYTNKKDREYIQNWNSYFDDEIKKCNDCIETIKKVKKDINNGKINTNDIKEITGEDLKKYDYGKIYEHFKEKGFELFQIDEKTGKPKISKEEFEEMIKSILETGNLPEGKDFGNIDKNKIMQLVSEFNSLSDEERKKFEIEAGEVKIDEKGVNFSLPPYVNDPNKTEEENQKAKEEHKKNNERINDSINKNEAVVNILNSSIRGKPKRKMTEEETQKIANEIKNEIIKGQYKGTEIQNIEITDQGVNITFKMGEKTEEKEIDKQKENEKQDKQENEKDTDKEKEQLSNSEQKTSNDINSIKNQFDIQNDDKNKTNSKDDFGINYDNGESKGTENNKAKDDNDINISTKNERKNKFNDRIGDIDISNSRFSKIIDKENEEKKAEEEKKRQEEEEKKRQEAEEEKKRQEEEEKKRQEEEEKKRQEEEEKKKAENVKKFEEIIFSSKYAKIQGIKALKNTLKNCKNAHEKLNEINIFLSHQGKAVFKEKTTMQVDVFDDNQKAYEAYKNSSLEVKLEFLKYDKRINGAQGVMNALKEIEERPKKEEEERKKRKEEERKRQEEEKKKQEEERKRQEEEKKKQEEERKRQEEEKKKQEEERKRQEEEKKKQEEERKRQEEENRQEEEVRRREEKERMIADCKVLNKGLGIKNKDYSKMSFYEVKKEREKSLEQVGKRINKSIGNIIGINTSSYTYKDIDKLSAEEKLDLLTSVQCNGLGATKAINNEIAKIIKKRATATINTDKLNNNKLGSSNIHTDKDLKASISKQKSANLSIGLGSNKNMNSSIKSAKQNNKKASAINI